MTNEQIKEAVDMKLNELIAMVQTSIGVETGDEAAYYFSGDRWDDMVDEVLDRVVDYRDHELAMAIPLGA